MRLVFANEEPHLEPNPGRDRMSGVPNLPAMSLDRHHGRVLRPGQVVRAPGTSMPVGTIYRYDRLLIDESILDDDGARRRLESAVRPIGLRLECQAASNAGSRHGAKRVPVSLTGHGDPAAVDAWGLLQSLYTAADEGQLSTELTEKVHLEHLLVSCATPGISEAEPPGSGKLKPLGRIPVDMVNPMPPRKPMDRRIRVAILDTGVPQEHPGFDVADLTSGEDAFVLVDRAFQETFGKDSDSPALPLNEPWEGPVHENTLLGEVATHFGHGTFMTGLIRQVAPDSQVYSLRVVHNDGLAYEHEVVGALHHVADQVEAARDGDDDAISVDIVVLAFGYVDENPEDQPGGWMGQAIERLTSLGVAVVAAAGNQSSDRPFYPAAYAAHPRPEGTAPVLSVGALNPNRNVAMFSNDGPWVACFATGAGLVSTFPCEAKGSLMPDRRSRASFADRYRESHDPDDFSSGYAVWGGTSFAAPLAAAFWVNAMAEVGSSEAEDSVQAAARALGALERLKNR
ncbi:S8/S53 family peptidase [Glycomyces sp. L485]|uniref:S8 family peptidase n=1 Tax=Glycomyces sp. L485 TaxID=2909235 RepID=UPI001F4B94B9|nr:S8/S53 family peptidase [Glycomyces sp. L485]MCH7231245.1 S8/S53 family peptidase [Glycomyces sp. L485]